MRRRLGLIAAIVMLLGLAVPTAAQAAAIHVGSGLKRFNAETRLNDIAWQRGMPQNIVCEPRFYRFSHVSDPNIVLDSSRRNDTREHIIHHPWNGGGSQKWALCRTNLPGDSAEYFLLASDTGGCVDLKDWADWDGAPFVERFCNLSQNQRFWISRDPVSDGVFLQVKVNGGRFVYGDPAFNVRIAQFRNQLTLYYLAGL